MESFGFRLRQAIADSPFNQKTLAQNLNVHQETITNYIKEKSLPSADVLYVICNLLDVSADWLLYGESDDAQKISNSGGISLTINEYDLLASFRQLNENDKIKVLNYMAEILEQTFPQQSATSPTSNDGEDNTKGNNQASAG